MKEIRKELFNARRLYNNKNYNEALEIFEKHYKTHPELFHIGFRTTYAWTIFRAKVSDFRDEDELFESAEKITELTAQQDGVKNPYCIYTISVLRVIKYLKKEEDYYSLPYWLEKLNPELLNDRQGKFNGRPTQSDREYYFEVASITYLNVHEYEKCVEVSENALKSLDTFTNKTKIWLEWRMVKALDELNQPSRALECLHEIIKVENDWYFYRKLAEIYFRFGKTNEALKYLCPAILSNDPLESKVNLYYLAYRVLDSIKSDWALMHAQLYYLLKMESAAQIAEEIKRLNIDEANLDKKELADEITRVWMQYRFKDEKLHYGTVSKYFNDKNYGFITDENDESVFFHKNELKDDTVYVGQAVSFYTEKSFDKAKNKQSLKAVNIRGE